jgi:hypothetical protein
MKKLIEKIKKFFSRKEKQNIEPYDEAMYNRFIEELSEYAKELGITTRKIGPIENPFYTGIGTCFISSFKDSCAILLAVYPHKLCIKWNPLENRFILMDYDIEKGKQILLEQLKLYKLHQLYLKEERMKADFE